MTDHATNPSPLSTLLPRLQGDTTALPGTGQPLSDAAWEDALRELREPEEISEAEARRLIEGEPRGRAGRFYRFWRLAMQQPPSGVPGKASADEGRGTSVYQRSDETPMVTRREFLLPKTWPELLPHVFACWPAIGLLAGVLNVSAHEAREWWRKRGGQAG